MNELTEHIVNAIYDILNAADDALDDRDMYNVLHLVNDKLMLITIGRLKKMKEELENE